MSDTAQTSEDLQALQNQIAAAQEELRQIALRHNNTAVDLKRMEQRHERLKEYETRAWKVLRDKDAELVSRETALALRDGGNLENLRTFLPEM